MAAKTKNSRGPISRSASKKAPGAKKTVKAGRTALIAGASGLTGGHCLRFLLENSHYSRVHALVRRPLGMTHPRLTEHIVDFDNPESLRASARADDVYCCLGTTIKKAGSRDAFAKVDFTYPVSLARAAVSNGASGFFIITALGANPKSKIFYNRVKGEVEEAIRALPFKSVHIFRPSLLLGERAEVRAAEKIGSALARVLTPLMVGPLRAYRAVEARAVAFAMVHAATAGLPGGIMESREIQEVWETEKSSAE